MSGPPGIVVPDPIQFLNWGWWIIHVVDITMVFLIGLSIGKKRVCKA